MAHHMTWEPASGVRQVNIRYKTNNPAVTDIERLREITPYKNLNKIMLEALLIGSRMLLKEFEVGSGGVVNISSVGRSVALGGPSVNAEPALVGELSQSDREKSYLVGRHLERLSVNDLQEMISRHLSSESEKAIQIEEGSIELTDRSIDSLPGPEALVVNEQQSVTQSGDIEEVAEDSKPEVKAVQPIETPDEIEQKLEVPVTPVKFSAAAKKHLSSW